MITIKKYSNRRLYDTSQSQYVTLEELANKIRAGDDVQVIDAKTNEDLTQSVLAQIIIESRGAGRLLPTQMLMQLIRMEDDALAEFFGQYMSWALSLYLRFKSRAQQMRGLNPMTQQFSGQNALGQWLGAMYNWPGFQNQPPQAPGPPGAWGGWPAGAQPPYPGPPAPFEEPPEPPVPAAPPEPQESSAGHDVAAMRKELDELKELLRAVAAQHSKTEE